MESLGNLSVLRSLSGISASIVESDARMSSPTASERPSGKEEDGYGHLQEDWADLHVSLGERVPQHQQAAQAAEVPRVTTGGANRPSAESSARTARSAVSRSERSDTGATSTEKSMNAGYKPKVLPIRQGPVLPYEHCAGFDRR